MDAAAAASVVPSSGFSSYSSNSSSILSMDKEGEGSSSSSSVDTGSKNTNSALQFVCQMLMEEDMEGKLPCVCDHDAIALQATEKSLYDVLVEKQVEKTNKKVEDFCFNVAVEATGDSVKQNRFLQSEWALIFNKGMEEASRFLPKLNHPSTTAFTAVSQSKRIPAKIEFRTKVEEKDDAAAVTIDEKELLELSDKVLLCSVVSGHSPTCVCDGQSLQKRYCKAKMEEPESPVTKKRNRKEVIDLRTLLISCAQALSGNDLKTFNEHLRQIRKHSSCIGDANQRLAHVFANALEARVAGTGNQIYTAASSKITPVAELLESYQLYLSTCPFRRTAIFFANHSILEFVKEKKPKTLHIIDFGVFHGFQWPSLIMGLQRIRGGPPKLRITGIELPFRGFLRNDHPLWDTRTRLARYCEIFNVPFEYNGILQKCETIQVQDLKLRPNEALIVNCLYRLQNLLDDTVEVNTPNPKDSVLKLIKEINPDMFIHSVVSGSFSTPFFLTRFRDALFHFSAMFDIFDASLARDNKPRLLFEQDVFGMKVMNVVACEGAERIERPESYKRWQLRTRRAGFKHRPLDCDLLNKLRVWMEDEFQQFHQGFTVETDGHWLLQGWKGRILFASSIWLPA